jgi:hypothetical protein
MGACIDRKVVEQLTLETLDNIMNIHEILLPIFVVLLLRLLEYLKTS